MVLRHAYWFYTTNLVLIAYYFALSTAQAGSGAFMCADRSKSIAAEFVNDDYCDCSDGSDEPLTAACSNGRFLCSSSGSDDGGGRERRAAHHSGIKGRRPAGAKADGQAGEDGQERRQARQQQQQDAAEEEDEEPYYVSSSKVNDGVCDCCSGRDEPPGTCSDRCAEEAGARRAQLAAEARLHLDGVKLKRQYVRRAKQHAMPELSKELVSARRQLELEERSFLQRGSTFRSRDEYQQAYSKVARLKHHVDVLQTLLRPVESDDASGGVGGGLQGATEFGSQNEFAPLFGRCFNWTGTDREFKGGSYDVPPFNYTFVLCPFTRVSQKRVGGKETLLGLWNGWQDEAKGVLPEDGRQLVMTFTHGEPCWQGPDRFVEVVLECGLDDRIRTVKEDGKCLYSMRFATPAACNYKYGQALLSRSAAAAATVGAAGDAGGSTTSRGASSWRPARDEL